MGAITMPTIRQKHKEIYWCWKAMKQRCLNPKAQAYKNYGKRGIGVCDQWMTFEPFLDWCLHHGWRKGLDLDRIDNDGDYTPNNCRFVTRQQNTNNRRCTLWLEIDNKKKTVNEWAKKIGVDRALIKSWLYTRGKQYAEQRVKEALQFGYRPHDYARNHRIKIMLVDKNMIFNSLKEAAVYVGMSPCALSTALNHNGGKTHKGYFKKMLKG